MLRVAYDSKNTLQLPAHAGSSVVEAIRSSETSVNKISIRHHIPEDGILHSHIVTLEGFGYTYGQGSLVHITVPVEV
jgi:hypothetical protein